MTDAVLIAKIAKGNTGKEEVRIILDEYRGVPLVNLRVFADFTPAHVMMPTKAGLALNVAKLPELAAAIQKALEEARRLGLIGGEA